MPNRKKVIDHLLIIRTWNEVGKAYAHDEMDKKEKTKTVEWIDDVLKLLKEQEPVSPIRMHHTEHKQTDNYRCGKCGDDMYFEQRFCECCGKAVKWD